MNCNDDFGVYVSFLKSRKRSGRDDLFAKLTKSLSRSNAIVMLSSWESKRVVKYRGYNIKSLS